MNKEKSQRARLSLEGLSIGDAFGQRFFFPGVVEEANRQNLPEAPWHYTDDTEMAMAVVQVLEKCNGIDQDILAKTFAQRFANDPHRGYGAGACDLLHAICKGADWQKLSHNMFNGTGSYGNGSAMRVAPLGAWFAEDVQKTIQQAALSAEVTHTHLEGRMGAIAVALAAGWSWRRANNDKQDDPQQMIPWVIEHLEESEVRSSLEQVANFPLDAWAFDVASKVGCGERISAQDTVAFCLWVASAHMDDYSEAMWTTARVGGDIDTTCAIIGGIVALSVGAAGIQDIWKKNREFLNW